MLSAIFAFLSLLHIYWAAGGRTWRSQSIPESGGRPAIDPSGPATLAVAGGLAVAIVVILGTLGWFGDAVPQFAYRWLAFATALVFVLRAIGDFRLVGYFKEPSPSSFAYWDSRLYVPLCIAIALGSIYVAFGGGE